MSAKFVAACVYFVTSVTIVETSSTCPSACHCRSIAIDCNRANLVIVPSGIPPLVQRLNLQWNQIVRIERNTLQRLPNLEVLQLMDNEIHAIDSDAFAKLDKLRRLRLDNNKLISIPRRLFRNNPLLYRIDLSHNLLQNLSADSFEGPRSLVSLQLNHNRLTCISSTTLRDQIWLETLKMNDNQIATLGENMFVKMMRLSKLHIYNNPFRCDCHLRWLSHWIKTHPRILVEAECFNPMLLRGHAVDQLTISSFQCGKVSSKTKGICGTQTERCPKTCFCSEKRVVCVSQSMESIPVELPDDTLSLQLSKNKLVQVPKQAFSIVRKLNRLDLSFNDITTLENNSFIGLETLFSLRLDHNKITTLPIHVFRPLSSLQVLYLNKNNIMCLPQKIFLGLVRLNILSLYANQISTIAQGTFTPLQQVSELHIGNNPFICDCNLRWLPLYLRSTGRSLDRSVRCTEPARMKGERITVGGSDKYVCKGAEKQRTSNPCDVQDDCPRMCLCEHKSVKCNSLNITDVPSSLATITTELSLAQNHIRRLSRNSILQKLRELIRLYLQDNVIDNIEEGAFKNLHNLRTLNLSNNRLTKFSRQMFVGLISLVTLDAQQNHITCLSSSVLSHLRSLRSITLYGNKVSCIAKNAFAPLSKLELLDLTWNPLNCNCKLAWLASYVRRHIHVFKNGQPKCSKPLKLKNTPVGSLRNEQMLCTKKDVAVCNTETLGDCCQEQHLNCDSSILCPEQCSCKQNIVSCRRAKTSLTTVPQTIPAETRKLFLSGNNITHIAINNLAINKLEVLDMSWNRIQLIEQDSFIRHKHLRRIILSYNRIKCIHVAAFGGLQQLTALVIQGNDISQLKFGMFEHISTLKTLVLGQNPLHCDCELLWLRTYFKKFSLDHGVAMCETPVPMQRQSLLYANAEQFICNKTTSPPKRVRLKCNVCEKHDCQNGGACKQSNLTHYTCECAIGYLGKRCELQLDACFGHPCANGGSCSPVGRYGQFNCKCATGFNGTLCENNVDDCGGNKCANSGTCVDEIGGYRCKCAVGYHGKYCQHKSAYCITENPCQNSARCKKTSSGYECMCLKGWSGKECANNIDDCVGIQCQNSGYCVDLLDGFRCQCRPGYVGRYCERLYFYSDLVPSVHICTMHECRNGGRCVAINDGKSYICRCLLGYVGKKCEMLNTIELDGEAYAVNRAISVRQKLVVQMNILPSQRSGLLFHYGHRYAFVIVEVESHIIRVLFSSGLSPYIGYFALGSAPAKFHKLRLKISSNLLIGTFDKARIVLKIDGSKPRFPMDKQLPMYIGGAPNGLLQELSRQGRIKRDVNFKGCIQSLRVNFRFVAFGEGVNLQNGCRSSRLAKSPHPCQTVEGTYVCQNGGSCVSNIYDPKEFQCKCRKNYHGRFCEKMSDCLRQIDFEYLVDAEGCRSTRKAKIVRCKGFCRSGLCCKPRKFRRRKVLYNCPGNRRKVTRVSLVRRCGCKPC